MQQEVFGAIRAPAAWRVAGVLVTSGACAQGFFGAPTVFDGCSNTMTIVQEEIFEPVMASALGSATSNHSTDCQSIDAKRT